MASVHDGPSPEMQQLLIYAIAGALGLWAAMKVLRMLVYSLPFLLFGMSFMKPDAHSFQDALAMLDKTRDSNSLLGAAVGSCSSGSLLGFVKNAIKQTAALFTDPCHEWVYLDLLAFIIAKKRGQHTYAIGALNRWVMLDGRGAPRGSPLVYVRMFAEQVGTYISEDHWCRFSDLPPQRQLQNGAGMQINLTLGGGAQQHRRGGSEMGVHRIPSRSYTPQSSKDEGEAKQSEKPIKRVLKNAQELVERGRFDEAAMCVEEGIRTCCRGGNGEEEVELWQLAAAYYGAGKGLLGQVKCRREAAQLLVARGEWAKAAELFHECIQTWTKEKRCKSNYGLVATYKAASLLLDSVLCSIMVSDSVKAMNTHRSTTRADPQVAETAESKFAAALILACRQHDSQRAVNARTEYLRTKSAGAVLEDWQERVIEVVMKRIDSGSLK